MRVCVCVCGTSLNKFDLSHILNSFTGSLAEFYKRTERKSSRLRNTKKYNRMLHKRKKERKKEPGIYHFYFGLRCSSAK